MSNNATQDNSVTANEIYPRPFRVRFKNDVSAKMVEESLRVYSMIFQVLPGEAAFYPDPEIEAGGVIAYQLYSDTAFWNEFLKRGKGFTVTAHNIVDQVTETQQSTNLEAEVA